MIGANLAVLLFLKFYPLGMEKLQLPALNLLMPMGISFYTLQVIAYCVDVWKGKAEAQENFFKYLLWNALTDLVMNAFAILAKLQNVPEE